jgi:signal transduction histidine kinase
VSEQIPRYILAPSGSDGGRLRIQLAGLGPLIEVASLEELLGAAGGGAGTRVPGWVLLPPDLDPTILVDLTTRLALLGGDWAPLLLLEGADGLTALPLAAGLPVTLTELAGRLEAGEGGAAGLSYRRALGLLSKVRHDINNALTVALAEAQLVLLDLDAESDMASSLRVVEGQIQRIRHLVSELSAIRAPRR